jgi:hypothetical protein
MRLITGLRKEKEGDGLERGYNKKKRGWREQLYLSVKKTGGKKDNIDTKVTSF